jgi:hypothetical protein
MADDSRMRTFGRLISLGLCLAACGGHDPPPPYGTQADLIGVGAACRANTDCFQTEGGAQQCLTEFKGGYCGLKGCTTSADCPAGSGCVSYNGATYCFRRCKEKAECNLNRSIDVESNCSSNIDFVEGKASDKPCIPPSG